MLKIKQKSDFPISISSFEIISNCKLKKNLFDASRLCESIIKLCSLFKMKLNLIEIKETCRLIASDKKRNWKIAINNNKTFCYIFRD